MRALVSLSALLDCRGAKKQRASIHLTQNGRRVRLWSSVAMHRFRMEYRMGCTCVEMEDASKRPFRLIARGTFATVESLAFAIAEGHQFKLKFKDEYTDASREQR